MGDPKCDAPLTPWTPYFLRLLSPKLVSFAFFLPLLYRSVEEKTDWLPLASCPARASLQNPAGCRVALPGVRGRLRGRLRGRAFPLPAAGAAEARSLPAAPESRIHSADLTGSRGPADGSATRGVGGGCMLQAESWGVGSPPGCAARDEPALFGS